ncbi:MAG: dTMP kinase [Acidobacteria bacterium]|nr:dTMP kinase [Acidobacteriota bacterium]MDW7983767.1 dTMP kinase [Acidobacteriota bacterium]
MISFEGVDGSGKTTQARRLAEALRRAGWSVVLTREPGGTPLGEQFRRILLQPPPLPAAGLTPRTELLLYLADRAQHLQEVVEPALQSRQVVISDRFIDSTLAYQGVARGFGIETLIEVHQKLGLLRWPDCTILLGVDPRVGLQRKRRQAQTSGPTIPLAEWSRFEREDATFHQSVAEGYRRLAEMFPDRIVVVPADADPDAVFQRVQAALRPRFPWLLP